MADAASLHEEYLETVVKGDFAHVRELFHPEYTYTGPDGAVGGIDAGVAVAETYTAAFPDMAFTIERHYQLDGDVSIIEFVATGTHLGELEGIPPTGKAAKVRVCNVIEVKDGRIWREREYADSLSMLQQLGVAPTEG